MGMASRIVSHLFANGNQDGQADGLEALAVPGLAQHQAAPARPLRRRRQQADAAHEALAQKVLHGWIQNRNQTLHPLTLNFRTLDAPQVDLLLQALAFAMTANGHPDDDRLRRAMAAIQSANGSPDLAGRLTELIAMPQSPQVLYNALHAANLTGHAYAITMAAINQRDPVDRAFSTYLASRLAIPETVSRGIGRRYRS